MLGTEISNGHHATAIRCHAVSNKERIESGRHHLSFIEIRGVALSRYSCHDSRIGLLDDQKRLLALRLLEPIDEFAPPCKH